MQRRESRGAEDKGRGVEVEKENRSVMNREKTRTTQRG